jgi:hypothetical protein
MARGIRLTLQLGSRICELYKVIVEVYRAFLPAILQEADTFMQDGVSVHTTTSNNRGFKRDRSSCNDTWPLYGGRVHKF